MKRTSTNKSGKGSVNIKCGFVFELMNETVDSNDSKTRIHGPLFAAFSNSPQYSTKYDSYFPVYEELLSKYRYKQNVTLVEVGVFHGGSLFMWREFFGPQARIIGIDLNPGAMQWEKHGFEIFIGDQGSDTFWSEFYAKVANIDIVIDDGGHTNRQQIVTSHHAVKNLTNGGLLVVEDVHTSYFREFGNPSKYSFIKFSHKIVDHVNSRSCALRQTGYQYSSRIYNVSFYESIVAFHINTQLCVRSSPTINSGKMIKVADFRYSGKFSSVLFNLKHRLARDRNIGAATLRKSADVLLGLLAKIDAISCLKYFKKENRT
jgi:hypothetical protein